MITFIIIAPLFVAGGPYGFQSFTLQKCAEDVTLITPARLIAFKAFISIWTQQPIRAEFSETVQFDTDVFVNPVHQLRRGIRIMDADDWEKLREEICTYLSIGHETGESELETVTRIVWLEREKNACLTAALEAIRLEVEATMGTARGIVDKSNVLPWPASRSARSF